jgi:hypothetical protein
MYQNWGFGLKINHLATLLSATTPFIQKPQSYDRELPTSLALQKFTAPQVA